MCVATLLPAPVEISETSKLDPTNLGERSVTRKRIVNVGIAERLRPD
jgi:hypothetical protein